MFRKRPFTQFGYFFVDAPALFKIFDRKSW